MVRLEQHVPATRKGRLRAVVRVIERSVAPRIRVRRDRRSRRVDVECPARTYERQAFDARRVGRDLDESTIPTDCRRAECTAVLHPATFEPHVPPVARGTSGVSRDQSIGADGHDLGALEDDIAAVTDVAIGADAAVHLDVRALHHYFAAGRAGGIDHSFVNDVTHQAGQVHRERTAADPPEVDVLRGRHHDLFGGDIADVIDIACDQRGHVCVDLPEVLHRGLAHAFEDQVAGEEVLVRQVEGGGNELGHIDLCALAEVDAVGVHQVEDPVCLEIAQYRTRVAADDP